MFSKTGITKRAGAGKSIVVLLYAAIVLPYLHSRIQGSYDYYLVVNYGLLFFLPLLIILLAFGESPGEYGLDKGDAPAARRLFLILFLPTFVVLAIAARFPMFQDYYPIALRGYRSYPGAAFPWQYLIYWELAYNGFYMFCWEFFFRGVLLFGLRPLMGIQGALWTQAILFGAMHWGKPMPEFYVSFLTGVALGMVALRTRSFLPTFGLHAACAISFDLMVLAWGGRF